MFYISSAPLKLFAKYLPSIRNKNSHEQEYLLLQILISGRVYFEWRDQLRPLFTKRTGVLLQDLVKSRSGEIVCYNDRIAQKFDRLPGSAAAKISEFQSN